MHVAAFAAVADVADVAAVAAAAAATTATAAVAVSYHVIMSAYVLIRKIMSNYVFVFIIYLSDD